MIGAAVANMPHGGDRRSDQAANLPVVTQDEAAILLNVSTRLIRHAKVLQDESPEGVNC